MPVTYTAKRALRSSKRKAKVNSFVSSRLERAIKLAKKSKTEKNVVRAYSLTDISAKKKIIHKNKAARIKSTLSKLLVKTPKVKVVKPSKKQ